MAATRSATTMHIGLLVALAVGATALRPAIVGVGPLLGRIQDDFGVSYAVVGLLGTIPVLALGLFAPFAGPLAARLGTGRALTLSLALVAAFSCLRAGMPSIALLLLCTLPLGIGMALGNALLPLIVKERFSDRPLAATSGYSIGMQVGSAVAALCAVPIAQAVGGWRAALAAVGAAACVSAVAWAMAARRGPAPVHDAPRGPRPPLPWRSGLAWRLVAMFCLLVIHYYGIGAWLADAYVEHGWSESSAGALAAVFQIAVVPGMLVVGVLGERAGSRRAWMVVNGALMLVGSAMLVVLPDGGFLWATLVGFGGGGLFTVTMALPLDVGNGAAGVGGVITMMLGIGFTVGAAAPLVMGALRDLTGSFTTSLWVVVVVAVLITWLAASFGPAQLRQQI
jgi:MFS transporter, CP family, cyanate transporter